MCTFINFETLVCGKVAKFENNVQVFHFVKIWEDEKFLSELWMGSIDNIWKDDTERNNFSQLSTNLPKLHIKHTEGSKIGSGNG